MMRKYALFSLVLMFATGFLSVSSTHAEGLNKPDVIAEIKDTGDAESKYIRLTTNHNKLIKLNADAASVIVNNPDHATVMLDTPRLLIVVPHEPGSTSFTVLDKNGHAIMQKDIIVTNVEKKYVRVRRVCGNDQSCKANTYYYCPDGCYEVTTMEGKTNNKNVALPLRNTDEAPDQTDETENEEPSSDADSAPVPKQTPK